MGIAAEIYDDVVEVIDTAEDRVLDHFDPEGRTVSQLVIAMRHRYGALAPQVTDVTDHRSHDDDPPGAGTDEEPFYPDVTVKLTGRDSNAGAIMAAVSTALRRHGVKKDVIDRYRKESMSGDYNNLLRTAMRWVEVE